jgi:hypothetical protein
MDHATQFWVSLANEHAKLKSKLKVKRGVVGAVASDGTVSVQFEEDSAPSDEFYARIAGFDFTPGNDLYGFDLNPGFVAAGPLQSSVTGALPLSLSTLLTLNAGLVNGDSVNQEWWPYGQDFCNQSGDVASTGSTATFQQAVSRAWTLPAVGTYDVLAMGMLQMTRSPAGAANLRLNINGVAGGTHIVTVDTAIYTGHMQWHAATGIAGGTSVVVKAEYKGNSGTGVTTSATEPWLFPWYVRTA